MLYSHNFSFNLIVLSSIGVIIDPHKSVILSSLRPSKSIITLKWSSKCDCVVYKKLYKKMSKFSFSQEVVNVDR